MNPLLKYIYLFKIKFSMILMPFSISYHHLWYQTTLQIMEEDILTIHQLSCFVGHPV